MIGKDSQKAASASAAQKKQVKSVRRIYFQYIQKGDVESARMVAEEAIRQEKQALSLKHLSLRMGGLASKLESAYRTQNVTQSIAGSVPLIKGSLKKMEQMGVSQLQTQVLKTMAEFEGVFDDLNIQTANIDEALGDVYGSGIPQTEVSSNLCKVNELIEKVQAEAGIEVDGELGGVKKGIRI